MASSSGAAGGKPQFSSSLMRLKFMQKGAKRTQPEPETEDKAKTEAAQEEEPKVDDSKWTATTFVAKGCRVVVERDPAPGARSGRMTFGKATDSSMPDGEAEPAAAAASGAAGSTKQGKPGKHSSGQGEGQGDDVQPLRPPKKQRR